MQNVAAGSSDVHRGPRRVTLARTSAPQEKLRRGCRHWSWSPSRPVSLRIVEPGYCRSKLVVHGARDGASLLGEPKRQGRPLATKLIALGRVPRRTPQDGRWNGWSSSPSGEQATHTFISGSAGDDVDGGWTGDAIESGRRPVLVLLHAL